MPAPLSTLAAMTQQYGNRMGRFDNGRPGWVLLCMAIFGVVLIAAIVWAAIAISRSGRRAEPTAPSGPTPREVLDQRYARGEIDTADYEERKRQLT